MTQPLTDQAAYLPYGIRGKRALITGGTTGIGRATALMLAANGANVIILGRHEKELNDTLEDFNKQGLTSQVSGIVADIATREGIEQTFQEVDAHPEGLDILVNNAALAYQSIADGSYSDWEYVLKTNLLGYLACSHEAAKRMKGKDGHIVNIGSMSAEVREAGSSVYVATKSGIEGFSAALRKELNPEGIKVTLIEPGAVGTDMQPVSVPDQREKEEKGEMLKAEDIAACVLYTLCQPKRCDVVLVQIRPHLQLI
ncbi:SDR family oxidoreductase [Chitinophaga horti]|uniref:SDR family oxidoreductase n=1 Tax=Chitinophaga horti TaxID=2920382 RepID=A0ABY6J340_9BACT|nr:SDR family oxidoreductase [Chitinophaga horti]UYQ94085.1 SDR family oxidoreductase [Chitinophaga horti]